MPKKGSGRPSLRTEAERNRIVEGSLRLVPWLIFHKNPKVNCGLKSAARIIGFADAIQEGNLGLVRAAELWDERGKFSTYAVFYIRAKILSAVKSRRMHSPPCESLRQSTARRIPDPSSDDPLASISRKEAAVLVASIIGSQPKRRGDALILRFGLFGCEALTLEVAGNIMGVTRERVRDIEQRSLRKIGKLQGEIIASHFGCHRCQKCCEWTGQDIPCKGECGRIGCRRCISWSSEDGYLCSDCKHSRSLERYSRLRTVGGGTW